jgi:hypothetical protein
LRPTRLCDWAAQTLVDYLPGATFKLEGTHEDLDRQIALLKRWIAGDRSISFDDVRPLPPYPAEVAESWPEVVMDFDASLGQVYDFSNQRTIYVGHGVRGEHGWGWEIVWIDVATASVVMRAPLGEGVGGSGIVGPVHGGSMFTMMNCGDPGRIVETDIRTGVVLGAVETPFRRGGSDRPLVVRGFGDTAISSDNRWLVALTSDGALHSVDLVTGAYTKEWQPLDDATGPEMPHCGSLTPVQGTNRFLITDLAKPTHMWDQDARQIAILERIPHRDWRAAWGPIALNGADSGAILWNIQTRRRIELPLPEDKVEDATPNGDQSVLFAMMAGGDIEVVDLDLGCVIARLRLPPRFLQSSMTLSGDGRTLVWLTNGREPDEEVGRSRIAVFDVTDFTR